MCYFYKQWNYWRDRSCQAEKILIENRLSKKHQMYQFTGCLDAQVLPDENLLIVNVVRNNTCLTAEIMTFSEKLRGRGILAQNDNGYAVVSDKKPAFSDDGKTLFIIGENMNCDENKISYSYKSIREAMDALLNFNDLICEVTVLETLQS